MCFLPRIRILFPEVGSVGNEASVSCVNGSITHASVSHSQASPMFCSLVFSTVIVHAEVEDW